MITCGYNNSGKLYIFIEDLMLLEMRVLWYKNNMSNWGMLNPKRIETTQNYLSFCLIYLICWLFDSIIN